MDVMHKGLLQLAGRGRLLALSVASRSRIPGFGWKITRMRTISNTRREELLDWRLDRSLTLPGVAAAAGEWDFGG